MKLNYITLKNFRQYCGEQTIHFATDKEQHVTVIHGVNGAGKTSVCIALNWCLYGDEFVVERFGNIGELVSKHPLANITGDDTSVKIGFTYQDEEYWAERKMDQGLKSFSLKKEGDPNPFRNEDAASRIQLMIPKDVSVHFFFDGEKIDNFALPGSEKQVKDAVYNVLNIEFFQRGIKHLRAVAKKYDQDLAQELNKQPPGSLKRLRDEKEDIEKKKNEKLATISEKQQEIKHAEVQIQDIDKELQNIKESRDLAEKRKRTEITLEQLRQEKLDTHGKIRSIANQGFIPMANLAVSKALEILDKNEISEVPEPLLQKLLENMRCICGRPIDDESTAHQEIRSLLAKAVSSRSATVVRDTYSDLKYVSRTQIKEIPATLRLTLSENQKLDRAIATAEASLKEISEKLKGVDQDRVRGLQNDRDQSLQKIGELKSEIRRDQDDIEEINKAIVELTKKIKKAETTEDEIEQLKHYWQLSEEAFRAMEKIHELFAENMQGKVEPKVQEIFKKLVWKSSHFQKVRLSKEFELQVIDRFGEQAKPELSAGERQVLSLAFIVAMAQVAAEKMPLNMENEPFPIVMDTPFGRLSREPRENTTKTIPEFAEQLILFVTDTELGGKAKQNLEPWIGKEYLLRFNENSSATTIEPIV